MIKKVIGALALATGMYAVLNYISYKKEMALYQVVINDYRKAGPRNATKNYTGKVKK